VTERGKAAFTLLEVLAAVAVVALVFTTLITLQIEAMGGEGEAWRRMRASLLADRVLGEIEGQLAAGVAPSVGRTESDEDPYRVEVEVAPYGLDELVARIVALRKEQRGRPEIAEPALLRAPQRGLAPLLSVAVRVSWEEGAREAEVRRTTFAFDPVAAAPILAAVAGSQPEAAPAEDGEPQPGRTPGTGRSGLKPRRTPGEPFRAVPAEPES
jgi:prepilin-type N-terminal cleavage/methylation domain-containing protein